MIKSRASWLTVSQAHRLDGACLNLARVFGGNCPYLVGSVLDRADFHDVDVRMMLPDKTFARMFRNPEWLKLANAAISAQLELATGLPIDFQFQDTTKANEEFNGRRHALGMWHVQPTKKER